MNQPTSPVSRRHLIRRAAGAAIAGTGLALAGSDAGAAPRDRAGKLPTVGQTYRLSLNAFGVTLVSHAPPPHPRLNFTGSRTLTILPGGPNFARYEVLDFAMNASHPLLGKVTLAPPLVSTPNSRISRSPDGLLEDWRQPIVMTVERLGGRTGPFLFTTSAAPHLVAHLTRFPPPRQKARPGGPPAGGALYRAQGPIRLASPGDGRTFTRLERFDVSQGRA
ncbi:hypothetical protein [Streptomyces sp. ISL-11]|uniref:hypothetical protein n=1 Tax=Streptomyces sp. ISL-11 TaxID=2819174 RepID=UPI001BEB5ADE|nr:hypothetical protein [Streptomyces sp. ISL-11]MBT2382434.1 hypothetical protein [Streptomyces sp. ISL-11]